MEKYFKNPNQEANPERTKDLGAVAHKAALQEEIRNSQENLAKKNKRAIERVDYGEKAKPIELRSSRPLGNINANPSIASGGLVVGNELVTGNTLPKMQ